MAAPSTNDPGNMPAPSRRSRSIILCFDGTADEYSSANTNVVKFCSLLKKDIAQQAVYYQAGIGTYVEPGAVSPLFSWGAKVLDEALATFLPDHVMEGYKFLMQNYNIGDRVYLFGFSRGAYTARALAGMLHKVGLLTKDNNEQVPFAYKLYKSSNPDDNITAAGFKETFCREVLIEFVGVWDTVASVGVIMGRSLPFVDTNTMIRTFRQALSLDEHRVKFRPNFYHQPVPDSAKSPPLMSRMKKGLEKLVCCGRNHSHDDVEAGSSVHGDVGKEDSSPLQPNGHSFITDVKEVWFAGGHSDIGGGAAPNTQLHALENIALRWMVREVMRAECSIVWEESAFARLNIPFTVPDEAGIQSADAPDADQPEYDALVKTPAWWLLEVIPTYNVYRSSKTGRTVGKWSIHLGRGRYVPKPAVNFHTSVKQRMDNANLKYKPRARYEKDQVTFVD